MPGTCILVVSGTTPYANMRVELVPRVYIQQPEYWAIEVVGCLPGIGLLALGAYTVALPLTGTTGTKGIEVVGATRSEMIDIPSRGGPVEAEGRLERLGVTTFQYGTHVLTGATLYALQSRTLELDRHIDQKVRVWGVLVPGFPLEGGPPLVEVERVQQLA